MNLQGMKDIKVILTADPPSCLTPSLMVITITGFSCIFPFVLCNTCVFTNIYTHTHTDVEAYETAICKVLKKTQQFHDFQPKKYLCVY